MQILKWMKTIWDLGILQQAFVCLCLPIWLDRLPLTWKGTEEPLWSSREHNTTSAHKGPEEEDLWPAREQKTTSTSTLCGCNWIMLGTRAGYIRDNLGDFPSESLLLHFCLLAGDRLAGPMGWCHSVTPTQPLIHLTLQLSSGGLCHWRTAVHLIFFFNYFFYIGKRKFSSSSSSVRPLWCFWWNPPGFWNGVDWRAQVAN